MSEIQIINQNGNLFVNSREVAAGLNKKHCDVLGKVREILTEREFSLSEYTDLSGKKNTEYLLTKDGFLLLCMNYTGYNDFKRAYIRRFNEMEAQLKQPLALPLNDLLFFHFKSTLFLVKPVDHLYEDHLVLSYQEHTISGLVQIGYPNVDTTTIRSDGRYCSTYHLPTNELKAIGKIVGRVEMDQNLDHLEELPGYIHGVNREPIRFQVLNVADYRYDSREMQEILRDLVEAKEEVIKLKQKEVRKLKKQATI